MINVIVRRYDEAIPYLGRDCFTSARNDKGRVNIYIITILFWQLYLPSIWHRM